MLSFATAQGAQTTRKNLNTEQRLGINTATNKKGTERQKTILLSQVSDMEFQNEEYQ